MIELKFVGVAFLSLLTVVNPVGALPVFLSLSQSDSARESRRMAFRAAISALVALVVFALAGHMILSIFSVSLDALRVVGGILFFLVGFDMLRGEIARTKAQELGVEREDVSITPLGIPLIAGPGSISTVMILMNEAGTFGAQAALFTVITAVIALTLALLLYARPIVRLIGVNGSKVLSRLTGLIVMMIAVEFFFAGLKPFVRGLTAMG